MDESVWDEKRGRWRSRGTEFPRNAGADLVAMRDASQPFSYDRVAAWEWSLFFFLETIIVALLLSGQYWPADGSKSCNLLCMHEMCTGLPQNFWRDYISKSKEENIFKNYEKFEEFDM